jgi:hypothetical protein
MIKHERREKTRRGIVNRQWMEIVFLGGNNVTLVPFSLLLFPLLFYRHPQILCEDEKKRREIKKKLTSNPLTTFGPIIPLLTHYIASRQYSLHSSLFVLPIPTDAIPHPSSVAIPHPGNGVIELHHRQPLCQFSHIWLEQNTIATNLSVKPLEHCIW